MKCSLSMTKHTVLCHPLTLPSPLRAATRRGWQLLFHPAGYLLSLLPLSQVAPRQEVEAARPPLQASAAACRGPARRSSRLALGRQGRQVLQVAGRLAPLARLLLWAWGVACRLLPAQGVQGRAAAQGQSWPSAGPLRRQTMCRPMVRQGCPMQPSPQSAWLHGAYEPPAQTVPVNGLAGARERTLLPPMTVSCL